MTALVSLSFLLRTPVLLDQGLTLMTCVNLISSSKALLPNTVTSRVKASTYEFGGELHNSVYNTGLTPGESDLVGLGILVIGCLNTSRNSNE